MFNQKIYRYNDLNILECEINSKEDINNIEEKNFDIVKLLISPEICDISEMEKNGYIFADRTMD